MIFFIFIVIGVVGGMVSYQLGLRRAHAMYHAFIAEAYGQFLIRTGDGEDATHVAVDVFSPERLAAWKWR